jgi:hypothetical protein
LNPSGPRSETSPDEPDAKAPPRRRPIFGALAILFLVLGSLGAAFLLGATAQISGGEHGFQGLGIMVLASLSFAVGCGLAAVAAFVGLVREERWQLLHLIVFAISLIPTLWLARVVWDGISR